MAQRDLRCRWVADRCGPTNAPDQRSGQGQPDRAYAVLPVDLSIERRDDRDVERTARIWTLPHRGSFAPQTCCGAAVARPSGSNHDGSGNPRLRRLVRSPSFQRLAKMRPQRPRLDSSGCARHRLLATTVWVEMRPGAVRYSLQGPAVLSSPSRFDRVERAEGLCGVSQRAVMQCSASTSPWRRADSSRRISGDSACRSWVDARRGVHQIHLK